MEILILNKNRGWRGLAEALIQNDSGDISQKMIFSFSQPVWDDMLSGKLVMQDKDNYIVIKYDDKTELPHPSQQRSVLIKNAEMAIVNKAVYPKATWTSEARTGGDYAAIYHFIQNNNHHTTSNWNCVGVRVVPNLI